MTEFEDESVMAMTTDPQDHYLLMGDTAGVIAVFDIRNYSISTYNNKVAIAAVDPYINISNLYSVTPIMFVATIHPSPQTIASCAVLV